jgi:hypothetical protein
MWRSWSPSDQSDHDTVAPNRNSLTSCSSSVSRQHRLRERCGVSVAPNAPSVLSACSEGPVAIARGFALIAQPNLSEWRLDEIRWLRRARLGDVLAIAD